MQDFNVRPFNFLPLNDGDLFDLTCEYTLSVLQRIHRNFDDLLIKAEQITNAIPDGGFELYKECFWLVDAIIDDYSKLIKCSKLSLGIPVGEVKNPTQIFQQFSYNPDTGLQDLITGGLRNTSQHFEERLQVFHQQINPFLRLSYNGGNLNWLIRFGKGGYNHEGNTNQTIEEFDADRRHVFSADNLYFHSYQRDRSNGSLIDKDIRITALFHDTLEMQKLLEENMEYKIVQGNICCPPVRGLSLFAYRS